MSIFERRDGQLFIENCSVTELAQTHGTPLYAYSKAAIEQAYNDYIEALAGYPSLVCYAVKANSTLGVLQILAKLGAGFDIVSVGELERVLAAGGDPGKVVFSGVGKTAKEMQRALDVGVHCFNIESEPELRRLSAVAAQAGKRANISVRVNPDVDAQTHPYISTGLKENKFGIDINKALAVYKTAQDLPGITITGVDCHIGSQLTDITPFQDALERLLALVDELKSHGIELQHIDMGGGLGINYTSEQEPPSKNDYLSTLTQRLAGTGLTLVLEPGRSIVGDSGILVTQVEYLKPTQERNFAIVDAAMNDNIRPSLYSAWQNIEPVVERDEEKLVWDVVGPVCESTDFLGKERALAIQAGDFLAMFQAGAYCFGMASNYNSRPRACELVIDGDQVHLVRQRETLDDIVRGERLLPTD